jgi:hypothetical protein
MTRRTLLLAAASATVIGCAAPPSAPPTGPMSFFVTSTGLGKVGDLGGLEGAARHCQALAQAVGAGNRTWRAYLSTQAATLSDTNVVNARDRIGKGPWFNAKGVLIARDVEELHARNNITKETALNEKGEVVSGSGDKPNRHDMLTGSRIDGTAFPGRLGHLVELVAPDLWLRSGEPARRWRGGPLLLLRGGLSVGQTVFFEATFWLLVLFSFVAPVVIYAVLLRTRSVSTATVLMLALVLIVIAGIDLYLLNRLASMARESPSLVDDAVFLSELRLALFLLPALFAGVGINLISHVLVRHLQKAEARFEAEHPERNGAPPRAD